MKLKNKETGKEITVSDARWARMKKYKRDHLYTVVGEKKQKKQPKVVIENLRKPTPKPKAEEPKVEEKEVKGEDLGEKEDGL